MERSSATHVDKKEKTANAPTQLKIKNLMAGERENLIKDGKDIGSGMVPAGQHECV